jgi:hypothetical protein
LSATHSAAPAPTHRLIASKYPPIDAFGTVATAADLRAVMELEGWTNDRLVADRIDRLPADEWVYGRPNASIVMAAFLHVAPGGSRFNNADLGAWYAGASATTSIVEVAHHLRRELVARGVAEGRRTYREYVAELHGAYRDIRGQQAYLPDVYDPASYIASQGFGEAIRAAGGDGILYDSVRHAGGSAIVAYRPRNIVNVVQARHFELRVQAATQRVDARSLTR